MLFYGQETRAAERIVSLFGEASPQVCWIFYVAACLVRGPPSHQPASILSARDIAASVQEIILYVNVPPRMR